MHSVSHAGTTSKPELLHGAIARAQAKAGEARRLATSILRDAAPFSSAEGSGGGWLWRSGR